MRSPAGISRSFHLDGQANCVHLLGDGRLIAEGIDNQREESTQRGHIARVGIADLFLM